ncbi:MAG: hypothetical protein G01um101493_162, partial [Microgenomates group bacterium Gr01-1014_93]
TTDEEAIAKYKETIERNKSEVYVVLHGLSINPESQQSFGYQAADRAVNLFLQELGFLEPNQNLDQNPRTKFSDKDYTNVYSITHSTKPFVAEVRAVGQREDFPGMKSRVSGPAFEGFVLKYIPKSTNA